eukprot:TRINITY_DN14235_c0_g1_i1.p1 TRINITY_DN14235_c0_g1~~TRINITY_DN14235_c0_g1_i1.p1  ORF type:complete len:345 (+),score=88.56 TRINITY_DN14235_c0_g1_i1:127-1161(+)
MAYTRGGGTQLLAGGALLCGGDGKAAREATADPLLYRHPAFWHTVWNFVTYSVWTLWNKQIFSTYGRRPLLSTGVQMFIVTAVVIAVQRATKDGVLQRASPGTLKNQLVPLSLVRSSDLGFANLALCFMSVAGQQILKATIPVWVCVLSIVYLKKSVPPHAWGIVLVIVLGTSLATVGDPDMSGTPFGVASMLLSCFCRAGKCVINARMLQKPLPGAETQQRLNKLTLLRYEAPMSGALILTGSVLYETATLQYPFEFLACSALNGLLMYVNQITYLAIVEHTSPIASQSLMNIKMIFLILLSGLFNPIHVSPLNTLGMAVAAGGAVGYSLYGEAEVKREAFRV